MQTKRLNTSKTKEAIKRVEQASRLNERGGQEVESLMQGGVWCQSRGS